MTSRLGYMFCLSVFLLPQLASSQPSPSASPQQQLIDDLRQVEQDPIDIKLVNNIHYVASDESHHFRFKKDLDALGGVFVGIGTNQNYTMLPWAKPELAIMMDFDQMVVDVHRLYRVAFLNTATPREFLKLWTRRSAKRFKAFIETSYGDDPKMLKNVKRAFRYARGRISRALRRTKKTLREHRQSSFLTSQDEFDFIVRMFKEDRIVMLRGDLTKDGTMRRFGDVLRKHQQIVRVYHPSNAEQYFPYKENYRRNVRALPHDAQSIVVRTRAWAQYIDLTEEERDVLAADIESGKRTFEADAPELRQPPQRKVIHYVYAVQKQEHFLEWLARPATTNVRDMLPGRSFVKNKRFEIGPPK